MVMDLATKELLTDLHAEPAPAGENLKGWLSRVVTARLRSLYAVKSALPADVRPVGTLERWYSALRTAKGKQQLGRDVETMRNAMRECPTSQLPAVPPLNGTLSDEFRMRAKETVCAWIARVNKRVLSQYMMKQGRTSKATKGALKATQLQALAPAFASPSGKSKTRTSEFASKVVQYQATNKLTNDAAAKTVRERDLRDVQMVGVVDRVVAVIAQARDAAALVLQPQQAAAAAASVPAATTISKYAVVEDQHHLNEIGRMAGQADCIIAASDSGAKGDNEHCVEVISFFYEPDDCVLRLVLAVNAVASTKAEHLAESTRDAWRGAGLNLQKQTAHQSDTCASMQGRLNGAIETNKKKSDNLGVAALACLCHVLDLALRAGMKAASGTANAW
jgi:hypothetical protein